MNKMQSGRQGYEHMESKNIDNDESLNFKEVNSKNGSDEQALKQKRLQDGAYSNEGNVSQQAAGD